MRQDDAKETGLTSRPRCQSGTLAWVIGVVGLTVVWHYISPNLQFDPLELLSRIRALEPTIWTGLAFVAFYAVLAVAMVPLTPWILVTLMVFEPVAGFAVALLGCLSAASAAYGMGQLLRRKPLKALAGNQLSRLRPMLTGRGMCSLVIAHWCQIFGVALISLAASMLHLRFRSLLLGTAIGVMPLLLALSFFEITLIEAVRQPNLSTLTLSGAAFLLILSGVIVGFRYVRRRSRTDTANPSALDARLDHQPQYLGDANGRPDE